MPYHQMTTCGLCCLSVCKVDQFYIQFTNRLPDNHSPHDLVSTLVEIVYDYPLHSAAAKFVETVCIPQKCRHSGFDKSLLQQICAWTASTDLLSLVSFLRSFIQENARVIDYIFLHITPSRMLSELCGLLDRWNNMDDYSAGQAMETFGGLFLSMRTLVQRHHLQSSLPSGIVASFLATPASACTPHSLRVLSSEHRTLVGSWITALYGNEGIDDDLIRATDPKLMLSLATTIVQQSLVACETGIIDMESESVSHHQTKPIMRSKRCKLSSFGWIVLFLSGLVKLHSSWYTHLPNEKKGCTSVRV